MKNTYAYLLTTVNYKSIYVVQFNALKEMFHTPCVIGIDEKNIVGKWNLKHKDNN